MSLIASGIWMLGSQLVTLFGRFQRCSFMEEVHPWRWTLRFQRHMPFSVSFLCFLLVIWDVNSQLLTFCSICYIFLLPCSAPLMLIYSALHKPKANPSFYKVPWLLFYHNNRKESNTIILYFVFIKVIKVAQICVSMPIKSY